MVPVWYYAEDQGQKCFVVYNDGPSDSRKRQFAAQDGSFLNHAVVYRDFGQAFKGDLGASKRLGELRCRPNLEGAVRAENYPPMC